MNLADAHNINRLGHMGDIAGSVDLLVPAGLE